MIIIRNVSMKFKLQHDKVNSFKQYFISKVNGSLKYDEFLALKNINFNVEKGEVVGIIGENGAGKSTLLKIIAGIMKPSIGNVEIQGNVVPMLELGSGFDYELTGKENIYLNGAILGYTKKFLEEKFNEIVSFSELEKFIDTPLRNYSSGMLIRLAFSIATIIKPDILIVDEILSVGDEKFQRKSFLKMNELMNGGTTVLFVSHDIKQIETICDKVIWLKNGRIVKSGSTKEICLLYRESVNKSDE